MLQVYKNEVVQRSVCLQAEDRRLPRRRLSINVSRGPKLTSPTSEAYKVSYPEEALIKSQIEQLPEYYQFLYIWVTLSRHD